MATDKFSELLELLAVNAEGTDLVCLSDLSEALSKKMTASQLAILMDTLGGPRLPTGPAGGDLTGTYPNPTLVNQPLLNNFSAVADPIATDDSGSGYAVGSSWVNTATDTTFICADSGVGVAEWRRTDNQVESKFDAVLDPSITNDVSEGYTVGSRWVNTVLQKHFVCLDQTDNAAVWVRTDSGDLPLNNFSAITDPTNTDDVNAGYQIGSRWINTSGEKDFVCLNAGASVAVWDQTNGSALQNNLGAVVDPTVNDDSIAGYQIGSVWINTATEEQFICLDQTAGLAVWKLTTGVQNNFEGTIDPAVTDDDASGYEVGSVWVNTTDDKSYTCVDATTAAAVWAQTNFVGTLGPLNNYAGITAPVPTDDSVAGYEIGSVWIDTILDLSYICLDASVGAAVWTQTSNDVINGNAPTVQVYTSSDTWTKPANLLYIKVWVTGGGGGGGGAWDGERGGRGGGAGATAIKTILASALASSETVTVGGGGSGGPSTSGNGGTGGTSSFGAHCSGGGSSGGAANTSSGGGGGGGGTASGGDINLTGGQGKTGFRRDTENSAKAGEGAASYWGGSPQDTAGNYTGNTGRTYGAGGGAGASSSGGNYAGGAGHAGVVYIEEFYKEGSGASGILDNYTAIVDPTVTDDGDLNYSIGSHWINTATDDCFICADNTVGAAVWNKTNSAPLAAQVLETTEINTAKSSVATLSTAQTTNLGVGDPIRFDVISGDYSLGTYGVVIPANEKAVLTANLKYQLSATTASFYGQWYNKTASAYVGTRTLYETVQGGNPRNDGCATSVEVSPLVESEYEFRIESLVSGTIGVMRTGTNVSIIGYETLTINDAPTSVVNSAKSSVATLSATQTTNLALDDPIRFDGITGDYTLDTYKIKIPAGETATLIADAIFLMSVNTASCSARWYDVTAGAYVGNASTYLPINRTSTAVSANPSNPYLAQPSVDTEYEYRISSISGGTVSECRDDTNVTITGYKEQVVAGAGVSTELVVNNISLSEIKTDEDFEVSPGQWKPIYSKMLPIIGPNIGPTNTPHGITSVQLDTLRVLDGFIDDGADVIPLPFVQSGATTHIKITWSIANITLISTVNWSNYSGHVTLEYCKTTDSATTEPRQETVAANILVNPVMNVVQTVKTDAFSTNSGSYVDITGFDATITPKSATSKIMVEVELGSLGNSTNELAVVNLQRNGVTVPGASSTAAGGVASANSAWCIGGGESNRTMTGRSLKFLDSPASISAQTYKCQMLSSAGSTSYLNRWGIASNGDCISSITLTEIPQ